MLYLCYWSFWVLCVECHALYTDYRLWVTLHSLINGDCFWSWNSGFGSMKKGTSSTTLNNHIGFSSGLSSTPSGFLPQIPENNNKLHDSKFSSLKRGSDGALKMPQVHLHSTLMLLYFSECSLQSCELVCRMERLEIILILILWFTIWACQKLLLRWRLSYSSNRNPRFLCKHVQKEVSLRTHEALLRGYDNLF